MKKLIVPTKYDGKRVSTYILNSVDNITNNLLYKTIRKKDIKINGKRISEDVVIHKNDEIQLYISDELLQPKIHLNIIYEDENILILNKPSNIEVTGEHSLTTQVHKKYQNSEFKPMPCHRLDRNTTGIILYAKSQKSLEILLNKFKNHEIEKHYIATVYGHPKESAKIDEAYLFKDNKKSQVYIYDTFKKGCTKIITKYRVIERKKDNTSILDVEIETGKTHQIRAHLAHLGYPIIGDGKYGINQINKKFGKKYQMLSSYSIKFNFRTNSDCLDYLNGKNFKIDICTIKN